MEVNVKTLRDALAMLEPAVPKKSSLPVLVNARLGEGKVVATDLEVAVTLDLPGAEEPMLLPVRDALQFLKYAPGHRLARLSTDAKSISILVDGTEAHFKLTRPEEYPGIPKLELEHEGVLDGTTFVRALLTILPYAAKEETRPVLCAVCLTVGDSLEAAAADGFRLVWEKIPGRLPGEGNLLIPPTAVKLLQHLWKAAATPDLQNVSDPVQVALAKRPIRLGWGKGVLELRFGPVALVAKLIQGTFPDYRQLIPTETVVNVAMAAEDMLRALQGVKRVAKGSKGIVRLVWEGETLKVSASDADVADTTVSIAAVSTGPGRTAIDVAYLHGYFKAKEGPVTLSLTAREAAPVLLTHQGTPHVALMPMMVKWDDAPAKESVKVTQPAAEATAAAESLGGEPYPEEPEGEAEVSSQEPEAD